MGENKGVIRAIEGGNSSTCTGFAKFCAARRSIAWGNHDSSILAKAGRSVHGDSACRLGPFKPAYLEPDTAAGRSGGILLTRDQTLSPPIRLMPK